MASWAPALSFTARLGAEPERRPVDFNFEVRPLLSDRCFRCHGPDERSRKAGLRLDTPEGAVAPLRKAGRFAIVPGHPEASELVRRILADDPDERMPPPESQLALSPAERDLLRRWVEEGGRYDRHWAFLPPTARPVPRPHRESWSRGAVDDLILDRLEREGLPPAAEAPRETLARRASLILTGLPPSLDALERFRADGSPDAYERFVDACLASPAYGERRANEWLDLARYADTYGYQADVERDLSPWRDWVIRSFNEDQPYDQFITWQVAGDLLEQPSRDAVLATAFQRLHRQTNEGGSIEEEFRVEYVADRLHTTGTAFLGLTLECARCHDHKYDPISQKEYYQLFAFFASIDESGLYSHFTRATPTPTLLLYPDGVEARHEELARRIADKERELGAAEAAAGARVDAQSARVEVKAPAPVASYSFDAADGGTTPNSADPAKPGVLVDGPERVDGKAGTALHFSGDNSVVLKGAGAFRRTDPFTIAFWIRTGPELERAVVLHRSRAWTDSGSRGYQIVLEQGRLAFALIHFWPGNAVEVRTEARLVPGRWTHVAVASDGSSRAGGLRVYLDGSRAPVEVVRDGLRRDIVHRAEWGDADADSIELTLAGRFRDSGLKDGCVDELEVFDAKLSDAEVRCIASGGSASASPDELRRHYVERVDPACESIRTDLRRLREDENRLVGDVPEIMVLRDMPAPRPVHVLRRGAYDAPLDRVDPGTPDRIFPFAADLPRNRKGLASWIASPRNPLTARVVVNRVWRTCFGRGLVATAENFGSQGQLPTHPELLDGLALDFVQSGWDLKRLFRQILTSSVFRQSSVPSREALEKDPENRLLARGPRRRLEAELIRDSALAASGLLCRTIGGRSVKPYQPPGLWEEAGTGKSYAQDHGAALYRRSLYTFWRRTAPPPSLLTFDATSREVCTAKRETTTTPLQALVLLNDPQYVEAARVLAERLIREGPSAPVERIAQAFRIVEGRTPSAAESSILLDLYGEQRSLFARDPKAADEFRRAGEARIDETLNAVDAAATTVLVSALFNLDEFITLR